MNIIRYREHFLQTGDRKAVSEFIYGSDLNLPAEKFRCPQQQIGCSCGNDGYCYDKNSKYPQIAYNTRNSQQNFELTWKIATDTTLIAAGESTKK